MVQGPGRHIDIDIMANNMPNLPPLIMGGAGWSYQLISDPDPAVILAIVKEAFARGVRAIDTSPYYEPSEELLGAALSHSDIRSRYAREDFFIMTKCGRIAADHFDYSPRWIRQSIERSLARFGTEYLDVVFCHDVEFVSVESATEAVRSLFELVDEGKIKYAGISGYDLNAIIKVAETVLHTLGRPVDVVQNWAQLSLQNTRLETFGLPALKAVGVKAVCNASPLACGLLRADGVPVGKLGDWHPAPPKLRAAAKEAAAWVSENSKDSLASVSLRFAISRAMVVSTDTFKVTTITGISTRSDLTENISAARRILRSDGLSSPGAEPEIDDGPSLLGRTSLDLAAIVTEQPLYDHVQSILGSFVDYDLMKKASDEDSVIPSDMKQVIMPIATTEADMPSRL